MKSLQIQQLEKDYNSNIEDLLYQMRLFNYMYRGVERSRYLERKYNRFREAIKICGAVD